MPRASMSIAILQRAMNDTEFNALVEKYNSSKKTLGNSIDREQSLNMPLTEEDKKYLAEYYNELKTSVGVIEKKYNFKKGTLKFRVLNVALRYLYQNRDKAGI